MPTDADARDVLRRYPADVGRACLTTLGSAGGFSGARLWRVEVDAHSYCLKAWPADAVTVPRLSRIHHLMHVAASAGLDFVPHVLATQALATCVECAGRIWDLQQWMPGSADADPSPVRIEAACTALARLHCVWAPEAYEVAGCPAVRRRLDAHEEWSALHATGWRPSARGFDAIDAVAARVWPLLVQHMVGIPDALAPWADRAVVAQPCLCDVWHAHVLYEAERVTGIVDFGSVKPDHVAADLSRFLGSVAGDDLQRWMAGLRAYRNVRALALEEEALARVLDRTGVLIGLFNWVKWLYREGRRYENPVAVVARLEGLVKRVEAWDGDTLRGASRR